VTLLRNLPGIDAIFHQGGCLAAQMCRKVTDI